MVKVFEKQFWHILFLVVSLTGIYFFADSHTSMFEGSLWGISTKTWFYCALISPILHQVYVLICWRLELYNKQISKLLGKNAFIYYKIVFALLIVSRPISIVLLAYSSKLTFEINTMLANIICILLLIPSIYLFYSVARYFGLNRAFGIDHFYPETSKNEPFVKKGIFKYTSNGMYLYGFLIFWVFGFYWQSGPALLVALFSHLYIWVHYYFTELPDIRFIYKK